MQDASYVVFSVGQREQPFKHFMHRADAIAFAEQQARSGEIKRAEIYKVAVTNTGAAVAAVKMGEGELVEVKGQHISEAEIQREWERAQKLGPDAVLKFLGLD